MSKPDPKPQTGGRFVIEDGSLREVVPPTQSHRHGDKPRAAKPKSKPKPVAPAKNNQKSQNKKG